MVRRPKAEEVREGLRGKRVLAMRRVRYGARAGMACKGIDYDGRYR